MQGPRCDVGGPKQLSFADTNTARFKLSRFKLEKLNSTSLCSCSQAKGVTWLRLIYSRISENHFDFKSTVTISARPVSNL